MLKSSLTQEGGVVEVEPMMKRECQKQKVSFFSFLK